jgi:hypothetical protein
MFMVRWANKGTKTRRKRHVNGPVFALLTKMQTCAHEILFGVTWRKGSNGKKN